MAVTSVRQISSREWTDKEKGEAQASRVYRVHCSSKADDPDIAVAACPAIGAVFSLTQPGLIVISRNVSEVAVKAGGGVIYDVTLEYSTKSAGDGEQQEEDPRDRPMMIRLGFATTEETIYQSQGVPTAENADGAAVDVSTSWIHGKAICNSVGKPFPDGISETFIDAVIQMELNVDTSDFPAIWGVIKTYANSVNSDNFSVKYRGKEYPVSAGTAWCTDPTSEPQVERIASTGEEVQYEKVSLTFRIRDDGWLRKILDQGFEEAGGTVDDPNYNKPRPLRDENGDPIMAPHLLNGKGKKLPGGSKPVFIKFKTKKTKVFKNLLSRLGVV